MELAELRGRIHILKIIAGLPYDVDKMIADYKLKEERESLVKEKLHAKTK